VSSASSGDPGRPDSGKTPEQAWRESFNAFERAVGGPMEQFLQSDQFADAAAAFIKANAGAKKSFAGGPETFAGGPETFAGGPETFGGGPAMWARAWGIASVEDVRRLEEQLDEARRRLDALERRASDNQTGSGDADGGT
jgi:hypothetical protein